MYKWQIKLKRKWILIEFIILDLTLHVVCISCIVCPIIYVNKNLTFCVILTYELLQMKENTSLSKLAYQVINILIPVL